MECMFKKRAIIVEKGGLNQTGNPSCGGGESCISPSPNCETGELYYVCIEKITKKLVASSDFLMA